MWPFKKSKRKEQADELRSVEAMTVATERSAKASELRLARKLNKLVKRMQDAPLDLGLEQIGRDVAGEP